MEVEGRGRLYTYRYTATTRMTYIKMGCDESHFNVSLTVRDKVTTQRPQITTFEVKGQPKRFRTEVPLLTSLTPYRQAKPAHKEQGMSERINTTTTTTTTATTTTTTNSYIALYPVHSYELVTLYIIKMCF